MVSNINYIKFTLKQLYDKISIADSLNGIPEEFQLIFSCNEIQKNLQDIVEAHCYYIEYAPDGIHLIYSDLLKWCLITLKIEDISIDSLYNCKEITLDGSEVYVLNDYSSRKYQSKTKSIYNTTFKQVLRYILENIINSQYFEKIKKIENGFNTSI